MNNANKATRLELCLFDESGQPIDSGGLRTFVRTDEAAGIDVLEPERRHDPSQLGVGMSEILALLLAPRALEAVSQTVCSYFNAFRISGKIKLKSGTGDSASVTTVSIAGIKKPEDLERILQNLAEGHWESTRAAD